MCTSVCKTNKNSVTYYSFLHNFIRLSKCSFIAGGPFSNLLKFYYVIIRHRTKHLDDYASKTLDCGFSNKLSKIQKIGFKLLHILVCGCIKGYCQVYRCDINQLFINQLSTFCWSKRLATNKFKGFKRSHALHHHRKSRCQAINTLNKEITLTIK